MAVRTLRRSPREEGRQKHNKKFPYTWVFNTWFFGAGKKSPICVVWAAPAAPKPISKGGGRSPPPSGMVFGAAGAAQTPKIDAFRLAPKTCKNPSTYGSHCDGLAPAPNPQVAQTLDSAELSRSLKVSDRRRNTPKSAQNRSESLRAGLWVPWRIFWAWFCCVLDRNPARHRRFPAGSLKVFGALLAQPRRCVLPRPRNQYF